MKTYSDYEFQTYEVSGQDLRIHWDVKQVEVDGIDGITTRWEANEAVCQVDDTRSALIQKIIGSLYSFPAELAAINNKEESPSEYESYQAFRAEAKLLADGWLQD
jgi:hypothetical protein